MKASLELGLAYMGRSALAVDNVALLRTVVTWVFSLFPILVPVALEIMDWSSGL